MMPANTSLMPMNNPSTQTPARGDWRQIMMPRRNRDDSAEHQPPPARRGPGPKAGGDFGGAVGNEVDRQDERHRHRREERVGQKRNAAQQREAPQREDQQSLAEAPRLRTPTPSA